jgi:hypothetical protein
MKKEIIPIERIARSIRYLRGEKVLLDSDLAQLYGVTTGNLNKAVNRNRDRFPSDFVFRLTTEETEHLIFQIGRSKGIVSFPVSLLAIAGFYRTLQPAAV